MHSPGDSNELQHLEFRDRKNLLIWRSNYIDIGKKTDILEVKSQAKSIFHESGLLVMETLILLTVFLFLFYRECCIEMYVVNRII